MDALEYITKKALIMCTEGGAPDYFNPTYNTTVKIHGCLVATDMDAIPLTNIPSFKVCKKSGGPCKPLTAPMTWENTWQVKIKGIESLLGRSTCPCPIGGTIEFMTSGQVPLPPEAEEELKALQEQAQRELDDAGYGDSVGETGFAEGMIPVWGSGRDMINDIQTGDVGGAILNGGFLLWDVGSIVAGVFSFGAGTAGMQGLKAGVKASIKAGAKAISKEALQQLGKQAFKKLSKEALKKSVKEMAEKLACFVVRACFTGETLVHTREGLKAIKDVRIGDEVYSYNEETGSLRLSKVTSLFEGEVEEILEIITEKETIRTTRSHPFYVNGAWKDAEQIVPGEYLFTKNAAPVSVLFLNYVPEKVKVYNFEVEGEHCYFVGEEGVLVLNSCADDILSSIPKKLLDGGKVDISAFTQKIRGSVEFMAENGWKISKDRAGLNSHGGSFWKLLDKNGNRIATLDEFGNILRK